MEVRGDMTMNLREMQLDIHENAVNKGFWGVTTKELEPLMWAMCAINEICSVVECWRKTGDKKWYFELLDIAEGLDVAVAEGTAENIAKLARLCLICTEVSEAALSTRKDNFAEELADTVIRCLDMAGGYDIDLQSAIKEKMKLNAERPYLHGKRC